MDWFSLQNFVNLKFTWVKTSLCNFILRYFENISDYQQYYYILMNVNLVMLEIMSRDWTVRFIESALYKTVLKDV